MWLKDLYKLEGLLPFAEDKAFREEWALVKQRNKERLAHHVQLTLGLTINTKAMFDVQIKVRIRFVVNCGNQLIVHTLHSVYMNTRYLSIHSDTQGFAYSVHFH